MKSLRMISLLTIAILMNGVAIAQLTQCSDQGVWTPQTFPYGYIDAHLLLTDGRVMAQYVGGGGADQHPFQDWYALTPTSTGTYINGSWSRLASLYNLWTPEYGPYSFASAVLKDGKVIVQGGEVNPPDTSLVWTTDGAIYNPFDGIIGSWSKLYPPTGWPYIGDAQSVVLQDGTYMVAACTTAWFTEDCLGTDSEQGLLTDDNNPSWMTVGPKGDKNAEEGYTLLPSGKVLTVDIGRAMKYEIYDPSTKTWSTPSDDTIVSLVGSFPTSGEIGPAILLTDGTVFATGAIPDKLHMLPQPPARSAIYNPNTLSWTKGPDFPLTTYPLPKDYAVGMGDESAVLLPDGNVLLAAHDDLNDYLIYEYAGGSFCQIKNAPMALISNSITSKIKMLLLPTGQLLITSFFLNVAGNTSTYYIYTPGPPIIDSTWRPVITLVNNGQPLHPGGTYLITGKRFNGLSQANMLGDDFQNATNYPLVQIKDSNNNVFYAPTHDHNTMGVATGNTPTWTHFDVPSGVTGPSATLVVIANGIASTPTTVTIQ